MLYGIGGPDIEECEFNARESYDTKYGYHFIVD